MGCRLLVFSIIGTLISSVISGKNNEAGEEPVFSTQNTAEGSGRYRFRYYVKDEVTGDFKVQEETREGASVRGSYSVAEPNGNLRTVTYTAEPGKGFEALVNVQKGGSPMKKLNNRKEKMSLDRRIDASEVKVDDHVMEMIPSKRYPTPKAPIGNDIGVARALESIVRFIPGGYVMGISSAPEKNNQGFRQNISVNFTMDSPKGVRNHDPLLTPTNAEEMTTVQPEAISESCLQVTSIETENPKSTEQQSKTQKGLEADTNGSKELIDEEIKEAFDSIPKLPELKLFDSQLKFQKDPEEASIDDRITEVARQLAETSLRREFEERKLGHILPISLKEYNQNGESNLHLPDRKSIQRGKSFEFPTANAPLVSRLPPENAQLQLITEIQGIPQHIYKEGFFPVTPAPELSGPLLGGPPLKKQTQKVQQEELEGSEVTGNPKYDISDESKGEKAKNRMKGFNKMSKPVSKSSKLEEQLEVKPQTTVRLPMYLRLIGGFPEYFFNTNNANSQSDAQRYPIYLNIASENPIVQHLQRKQTYAPQEEILTTEPLV